MREIGKEFSSPFRLGSLGNWLRGGDLHAGLWRVCQDREVKEEREGEAVWNWRETS